MWLGPICGGGGRAGRVMQPADWSECKHPRSTPPTVSGTVYFPSSGNPHLPLLLHSLILLQQFSHLSKPTSTCSTVICFFSLYSRGCCLPWLVKDLSYLRCASRMNHWNISSAAKTSENLNEKWTKPQDSNTARRISIRFVSTLTQ